MTKDEIEQLKYAVKIAAGLTDSPLRNNREEMKRLAALDLIPKVGIHEQLFSSKQRPSDAMKNLVAGMLPSSSSYHSSLAGIIPDMKEMLGKQSAIASELMGGVKIAEAMKAATYGITARDQQALARLHELTNFPSLSSWINQLEHENARNTQSALQELTASFEIQRKGVAKSMIDSFPGALGILEENKRWQAQIAGIADISKSSAMMNLFGAAASYQSNIGIVTESILGNLGSGMNAHLARSIIEPSLTFSEFSRRTLNRIANETNELNVLAYTTALRFGEQQLGATTSLLSSLMSEPWHAQHNYRSGIQHPSVNLFEVQRRELRIRSEEIVENNDIDAAEASIAGKTNKLATNCIEKLIYLNDNSKIKGNDELFPVTNRMLESVSRLPLICAENQAQLGIVVDYLYYLFYEGAGAGKLRFITFGLVSEEEAAPIFAVKMLRSKWLRHDPDHGSPGEIAKKYKIIGETLEMLGLNNLPRTKADFSILQVNLLGQLVVFLNLLIERLDDKKYSGH